MRILTISPGLHLGGTQRAAQNFSIGYRRQGCEVIVLNHGRDGHRRALLEAEGCNVVDVSELDSLSTLDLGTFDVTHIHREGRRNDRETELLKWCRTFSRIIAETNVFFAIDYGPGAALIDAHMHLAEVNLRRWVRRGGMASGATKWIDVVPNPVNCDEFVYVTDAARTEFRRKIGIPDGAYVFGRVGQPIASKWDPIIVNVFAQLTETASSAYLLLVGAPGDILQRLDRLHQDIRKRIIVLDTTVDVSELSRCYATLDCFIHAARQGESFGYVLAEALFFGIPVVTLSTPHRDNAQTEVIRHGIDGLVVRSPEYLLEGMQRMMCDEGLRKKVRETGRQSVIERFGIESVSTKALNLFSMMLDNRTQPSVDTKLHVDWHYDVAGLGRSDPIQLMFASILDKPLVNRLRENILRLRRAKLKRMFSAD